MEFKIGNKKIGKDTLIFNMGSATECPSKLKGLCDIDCYALKAERQYSAVLPYRKRQEADWLNSDAFTLSEEILAFVSRRKTQVKYIRVNEAGDLHTGACLDKLIKIARILPQFIFYTYTHRSDLVTSSTHKKLPKNLVLNTSDFKRTGLNQFKTVHTTFKVTSHQKQALQIREELQKEYKTNLICLGDCSACNLCKISHKKNILVPLH